MILFPVTKKKMDITDGLLSVFGKVTPAWRLFGAKICGCLEENSMEQSHSSMKRRCHSLQYRGDKQTYKMKKTGSKNEKTLTDTCCQTMMVQLKTEESGVEDLTVSSHSQTDTGQYGDQPTLQFPTLLNTTLEFSTELGDPPLLRKPQQTTMTGIQQIIECFRSGTVQAKLTLLKEVDTIFECQLCRSLFRGLPNLLEHRQSYCLSRQPELDDPSQVMKDLIEAVFPQRENQDLGIIPQPVHQEETSNSHQRKLCGREPVVVLRRFQQLHTASVNVGPVSQEKGNFEQVRREDGCEESQLSRLPDTMTSKKLEQPETYTLSRSSVKKKRPSSSKAGHVNPACEEGQKGNMHCVPTLKKTFSCRVCKRTLVSQRTLVKHMRVDHDIGILRKGTAKKAKSRLPLESRDTEACEKEHLSAAKRCHVRLKSYEKEPKVPFHYNEVKQDCTTPSSVAQPGKHLSTLSPIPQNQPYSRPDTEVLIPRETVHFSNDRVVLWMKDLFRCGLCKHTFSSQVLLMKHMSISHKFHMLEHSSVANRTPPPRKVKTKVKANDKASDKVRVFCWLCGRDFCSRKSVRSHCFRDHKEKLKEINMLLRQGIDNSLVQELHSLENGFAASQTP